MAVEIKVPSVGESISEGSIARWLKKEGDRVKQDDPLFELETEKATTEVPAPTAGVLHITVKEGEKVAIGSVVGSIDESAAAPASAAASASPAQATKTASAAAPEPPAMSPAG